MCGSRTKLHGLVLIFMKLIVRHSLVCASSTEIFRKKVLLSPTLRVYTGEKVLISEPIGVDAFLCSVSAPFLSQRWRNIGGYVTWLKPVKRNKKKYASVSMSVIHDVEQSSCTLPQRQSVRSGGVTPFPPAVWELSGVHICPRGPFRESSHQEWSYSCENSFNCLSERVRFVVSAWFSDGGAKCWVSFTTSKCQTVWWHC